ncbi:MAG: T9SS type A sorting domain-containing protein [Bacteroidia bacterium]
MRLRHLLLCLLFIVATNRIVAQNGSYVPDVSIPVTHSGTAILNPWVGGFNAPIFSEIDLNGDGIKDLFVFDRDGFRITTYINNGTAGQIDYQHAPEYRKLFPSGMHDWVLLKDFNCDGKEDIFTYSYSGGMTVYRNDFTPQNGLQFSLAYTLVNSKYGTITANLYVASVNLPALVDVDADGDLDVLTFPVSGSFVEFHRNRAVEQFGVCDTLVFQLDPNCFGNFGLSGFANEALLNVGCRMAAPGGEIPVDPAVSARVQHAGSCMISFDIDGDGDKDLMNGDILGNNMLLVVNGGSAAGAVMTAQDDSFPSYDDPVDLVTFPAPYYFDVNNDGDKDFIVAPCISGPSENYNNVLYYTNTTDNATNVFSFIKNRFLVDEMIEVGSGANVVFQDVDKDGLVDIVVGNYGYYSPTPPFVSGLAFYRNVGTTIAPSFSLVTQDLANLSQLGLTSLSPGFGDIDSDGDDDLVLGHSDGGLLLYTNNGTGFVLSSPAMTTSNGTPIDVGSNSTPQLYDVNKDGKLDLLVGERAGTLNYYENSGTAATPAFNLVTASFGNVLVNNIYSLYGYSYPFMYDSAGTTQLLVGAVNGYIYQYNNIDNNLLGNFNLVDSMYHGILEPQRITVASRDITGDGIREILTGNYAGGITIYKYDSTTGLADNIVRDAEFQLYPNPASDVLVLRFNKPFSGVKREIKIIDITGREVMRLENRNETITLPIQSLASGMYRCVVSDDRQTTSRNFVIAKP